MTHSVNRGRTLAGKKPSVLITDVMHPAFMKGLRQQGFRYDYQPDITPEEAIAIIEKYAGIVVNSRMKVGRQFIDRAKNLRFLARAGSGMENIDVAYLEKKKIHCISSPEGNRDAVGEHALGMLLGLLHNINKSDREVRGKAWLREENRGEELQGKTVGIIGYGHTGSAFAKKLKGFDARVIAYDKYKKNFSGRYAKEVKMSTLFREADIVSFHIPLTVETACLADKKFLNRFRKSIYLLNTSRGKILKTADLLQALESGKVKKAALDVLENESIGSLKPEEKKWFEKLVKSDRVILTPHIAGWSFEAKEKIAHVLLDKIDSAGIMKKTN